MSEEEAIIKAMVGRGLEWLDENEGEMLYMTRLPMIGGLVSHKSCPAAGKFCDVVYGKDNVASTFLKAICEIMLLREERFEIMKGY